ncbi:unnamed protein product [Somion occarium]|uniref:Uncharacterized protein n=1 Tax=Somion occarium TaxID=3059160 RepID=A0ABP1CMN4_9APHY
MNGDRDTSPLSNHPTERTPLISSTSHHVETPAAPEPLVDPVVNKLRVRESGFQHIPVEQLCPDTLTSEMSRVAFVLVVLLSLHQTIHVGPKASFEHLSEHWRQERRDHDFLEAIRGQLVTHWEAFLLPEPSTSDIEHVLWVSFPLNESGRRARLVDLLALREAPGDILAHHVVYLSLLRTWTLGPIERETRTSILGRVSRRFVSVISRVLHLLDLLVQVAFLLLLVSYVLRPPTASSEETSPQPVPGTREILLMIYSSSQIFRPIQVTTISSALVLFSFLSRLPSVPYPDDFSFGTLMTALTIHILQLHLPVHPSPVFLLPFQTGLPLTTLVWHGVTRIFLPVLAFFLPAILIAFFLLSISLSDVLLHFPFLSATLDPAPLEARTTFVFLLALLLVLMVCSVIMLVLVYPFLSSSNPPSEWDRYSTSIGLDARRSFIRLVVAYSERRFFPPPFNLLQFFFIRIPEFIFVRVGAKKVLKWLDGIEGALWSIFVLPVSLVLGSFFLLDRIP